MSEIAIRNASREEATTIAQMIRLMVTDMASYGGYAPAEDDAAWEALATAIAEELDDACFKYVFAQSDNGEIAGVAGAKMVTSGGAFAPRRILHIGVIYVRPQFRRQHIGDALMSKMLEWGISAGVAECELNVLTNNPAKSL